MLVAKLELLLVLTLFPSLRLLAVARRQRTVQDARPVYNLAMFTRDTYTTAVTWIG